MDGPFISVGILKDKIFETKHLGTGKDLDIVVSNAQTNEGLSSMSNVVLRFSYY
jgi:E3 ubiquitin-protein ligase RBBP6